MKLLMYCWESTIEHIVLNNLKQLGHEVIPCHVPCRDYLRDMGLAWELMQLISQNHAEAVFSMNYFPIISSVCETAKIPYYCWVYDSPHFTLFAKEAKLSCNHIYIFDDKMGKRLKELGVNHVSHLPLASDADYFHGVISRCKNPEKYRTDVSFVGSFYADQYDYYGLLQNAPDKRQPMQDMIEQIIRDGCFVYGEDYDNYLQQLFGQNEIWDVFDYIQDVAGVGLKGGYFAEQSDVILPAVLEKRMTVEERRLLMGAVAEGSWSFRVYTNSALDGYPPALKKANRGIADYGTDMPLIFHESKINLNLSLRSIHSGIPLRVMDIMACGGFVLSNEQPELTKYFEEGREIVTFHSQDDCLGKISYYLAHEKERAQIARAGCEKVREEFNYKRQLREIFYLFLQ